MVLKMSPKKTDARSPSNEGSSTPGAAPQRVNPFARRSTTDIRIQSLLHRDNQQRAADDTPTIPELPSMEGLDQRTEPNGGHPMPLQVEALDPDVAALLTRICAVDGFLAGAVLDADLGELLLTHQNVPCGDVALAAQLSFAALPTRAYGQQLRELATITATRYEFTTLYESPSLSLVLFTLWDRAHTNLVLAHMELSAALATCIKEHAARIASKP
jgi:hypothetical protein